jgi:hypothetical protein
MRFLVSGLSLGVLTVTCAFAQLVISAHSGVVQYVEGQTYLDGQPVELKFGHFPDIKQDQEFRTEEGRAEILLTPGVFLRLGENSAIRMLSNGLTDTRVELLGGSAIVECDQIPKDNSVMLLYKGHNITLAKHGLYRVDAEPARLQVYDGEALVKTDSGELTLKSGKQTDLGATLLAQNFDKNAGDELYRWANRRASYVAQANVSSASSINGGGYGYGYGYSSAAFLGGGWSWNPLFGMFTVVPLSGMFYSPFGYPFWSPYTVFNAPVYSSVVNHGSLPAWRTGRGSSIGSVRSGFGAASSGMGAHAGGFAGHGGGHAGGGGHGR